ncbi:MAG TPA: glycosyltransferase family 4 protein [Candidatus Micrarchaeia archaeon]|nr:glycosyltransferase family 4 protein [Candidatus Micrarchaeia archaeon]
MLKIGLVSPYDYTRPGGVGEHIRHLAAELRARDHVVRILAPAAGEAKEAIEGLCALGRPIPVPTNGSIARISLSFHLARRIRQILDQEAFDVLHFHEPLMPALPVTALRLNRHGVNVGTFHAFARQNLGYYYGRPILRRLFRRLDACIAVSEPARTFVSRYFPADYHVVPNGIDLGLFRPRTAADARAALPSALRPQAGVATILFVGRMEERKGLAALLEAYALLRQVRADCRLVAVGDGPMRLGFERWVEEEAIPDVTFTGYVDEPVKIALLAGSDIFCAPNFGKESFGVILLEAMASGRAIVATAIDGFRHVLHDGEEGWLVPPRDTASLAAALGRLLDDPGARRRMGEAGRSTAQRYSWSRVTDEVLAVYQQARSSVRPPQVTPLVQQSAPELR